MQELQCFSFITTSAEKCLLLPLITCVERQYRKSSLLIFVRGRFTAKLPWQHKQSRAMTIPALKASTFAPQPQLQPNCDQVRIARCAIHESRTASPLCVSATCHQPCNRFPSNRFQLSHLLAIDWLSRVVSLGHCRTSPHRILTPSTTHSLITLYDSIHENPHPSP
jgi:hypothetical protein